MWISQCSRGRLFVNKINAVAIGPMGIRRIASPDERSEIRGHPASRCACARWQGAIPCRTGGYHSAMQPRSAPGFASRSGAGAEKMSERVLDVGALIETRPIGRAQWTATGLCGFVAMPDGLDLRPGRAGARRALRSAAIVCGVRAEARSAERELITPRVRGAGRGRDDLGKWIADRFTPA
jgi:hypothetical protein